MRPLEILSLSVLAVTLVAIPITGSRRPRWLRFLPAFPAIAMLFQVLFEGYRWQMVPAYALSVLLFLAGLPTMINGHQPATPIRRRRVMKALAIAASVAAQISPIDDVRSTAEYRREVSPVLLRRTIEEAIA